MSVTVRTGPRVSLAARRSADHVEHEGELGAARACLQIHRSARVPVAAGAAGYRERAVLLVVERPLDRDLPAGQERGEGALVGLAGNGADARALVSPGLLRVLRVEDLIGERQDVAGGIPARTGIRGCVRGRVLN